MAPHAVIQDGLMTIFFSVVGMETKRELAVGELRERGGGQGRGGGRGGGGGEDFGPPPPGFDESQAGPGSGGAAPGKGGGEDDLPF